MSTKHGLAYRFYMGQISYDFIGHKKSWYAFSAVVLVARFLAVGFKGLALDIGFRGGTDFHVAMPITETIVDEVCTRVVDFEVRDLGARVFSLGESAMWIQTRSLDPEEIVSVRAAIAKLADVKPDDVTYTAIGASWDEQISRQALIALGVFIALVMVLIGFWFRNWKVSLVAVIALAYDLVATIGIYTLSGFTVTSATVIGVLVILGYSPYDTVVVFDRVSENMRNLKESRKTYGEAANLAINQVLTRSLNTTLIGILPITALLIGGAMLHSGPLADLGLVLFIGMIAGAYSSILIATPLLVQMREREPAQVAHRASLARKAERAAAKAERKPSGENTGDDEEDASGSEAVISSGVHKQRSDLSREQGKRQRRRTWFPP